MLKPLLYSITADSNPTLDTEGSDEVLINWKSCLEQLPVLLDPPHCPHIHQSDDHLVVVERHVTITVTLQYFPVRGRFYVVTFSGRCRLFDRYIKQITRQLGVGPVSGVDQPSAVKVPCAVWRATTRETPSTTLLTTLGKGTVQELCRFSALNPHETQLVYEGLATLEYFYGSAECQTSHVNALLRCLSKVERRDLVLSILNFLCEEYKTQVHESLIPRDLVLLPN